MPLSQVEKKVEVLGLPHLAKNERDMGHPTLCGRERHPERKPRDLRFSGLVLEMCFDRL
jgi:hypothetical protein